MMNQPENYIIQELRKVSLDKYPRMWCELNSRKFPEELKHIEPEWWDNENRSEKEITDAMKKIIWPLMHEIIRVVGSKAVNREWKFHSSLE